MFYRPILLSPSPSLSRGAAIILSLASVFAVCMVGFAPSTTAQSWATTEWHVGCRLDDREILSEEDCDPDAVVGPASAVHAVLEDASPWLEELGFRAPDVPPTRARPVKYKAWISETRIEDNEYGLYDGDDMYLNSTHFFALGENERSMGTAVHELFHAIQHSYHSGELYDGPERDWIWEGTADAVMLAYMRTRHNYNVLAGDKDRYWDYSLHKPYVSDNGTCYDCYNTSYFWVRIGSYLVSRDLIAFLDEFLQRDLSVERGLESLDQFLNAKGLDGLYEIFPQFVADQVLLSTQFSPDGIVEKRARYSDERQTAELPGHVRPVAARAYDLSVPIPEGKTAGLRIEFVEDHPDLHLVVDDVRYDKVLPGGAVERNVFRTALSGQAEPHRLFVRVVNVAEVASDSRERDYTLKITLDPIEPCSQEAMAAAVNEDFFQVDSGVIPTNAAGALGMDLSMPTGVDEGLEEFEPNEGTLSLSGLISDGGVACTYHLAALDFMGAARTGKVNPDEEWAETMRSRAEVLKERFEEEMRTVDRDNPSAEDMARIRDLMSDSQDAMRPSEEHEDVVLQIFSPHTTPWKFGMLSWPWATKHRGQAGWMQNAAANLLIQLEGTSPGDLEEGGVYQATAVGVDDPSAGEGAGSALSSMGPFYTQWEGDLRKVDGHWAFQGTQKLVATGRLTGSVTVEAITGAEVIGTFDLSGPVTVEVEESVFTYDDAGQIRGSRGVDASEERGPLTMHGEFSAPYHTPGAPRMLGYRTVVLE